MNEFFHHTTKLPDNNPDFKALAQEEFDKKERSHDIHNGDQFLTPEENDNFKRLYNINHKSGLIFLREKWAEHVDREFIQEFKCIHWVSGYDGVTQLTKMLSQGKSQYEISSQGYDNGEELVKNKRWCDARYGLFVDGTVTLASNADIQTNQWFGIMPDDDIKRRKYTEYASRLMTNKNNRLSPYEFIVDDWEPKAIICDKGTDPETIKQLHELSIKFSVPLIYSDDKTLFT